MNYRLPTYDDYEIIKDYVIEHFSNNERRLNASLYLTDMDYKEWVDKVNKCSVTADEHWGKYYLYLVFDNDRLVGLLHIRYELTDDLRERYGDIGYGVRPSERRKGYATKMLKYALDVCREKNLKYAIIGAYEKNYGSNKTIEKNGGVLYKKEIEPKELSDKWKFDVTCNFYRIDL